MTLVGRDLMTVGNFKHIFAKLVGDNLFAIYCTFLFFYFQRV